MHAELRRPGVTLELLHLEYLAAHPDGYRYSAFCGHYRRWLAQQRTSMRQVHTAGEKTFVDYAGQRPSLVDPATAANSSPSNSSSPCSAPPTTPTPRPPSPNAASIHPESHADRGVFWRVSAVVVPDQLRTGITDPCRYEPTIQRTYADWARHYRTAIVPARPAKPRDKAKVEVAVQVAERWILAPLRNETFFTLAALNARIAKLLTDLNDRPMKGYGGASRPALFERFDRPALQPLPRDRYVHADWRTRASTSIITSRSPALLLRPARADSRRRRDLPDGDDRRVLLRGVRVWLHVRSYQPGRHTTIPEHMPKAHRAHLEWSPSRLIGWGATIGRHTEALVQALLESRPHPEQGYRSCLGILRLAKQHGPSGSTPRARALAAGARSYRHVESILKHGLDRLPWTRARAAARAARACQRPRPRVLRTA